MSVTFEIEDDNQYRIDGKWDYISCSNSSQHLYLGYDVENNNDIYMFIAEYCNKHTESHGEETDEMFPIGNIK